MLLLRSFARWTGGALCHSLIRRSGRPPDARRKIVERQIDLICATVTPLEADPETVRNGGSRT